MKIHFFTHADNQPAPLKIRFFTRADNQPTVDAPAVRKNQHKVYSDEEKQFMRDNWQTMTTLEIAQVLGRSKSSVASTAGRLLHLIKNPEAKFMALSKGQQARKDAYTKAEKQYLRDNWQIKTIQEIAEVLGRTRGSVKSQGQKKMGLQKTAESISRLAKRPNAGQYKKGNLPQTTIFSDEPVIRSRHHRESNRTYLYLKIAHGKWQQYHQWMWVQANGPIPEGHIVVFKNGDQMDVRLDNLEMITQKENSRRNSASTTLPDRYVANTLAWRDKASQEFILENAPELIELKRAELQLNRTIKNHTHEPKSETQH